MSAPPIPENETKRLEALQKLQAINTPAEERYDRITRLARRVFDVPIALITLIDANRQWFKSCEGLTASETPRHHSFCAYAIISDETFIITDARSDPRFSDNPLVTGEPYIRFYAGQPLHAPDGSRLGTLCVIDRKSREIMAEDIQMLKDLALVVEKELQVIHLSETQGELISKLQESERLALIDGLTQVWNRKGILQILEREMAHAARRKTSMGLCLADIDYFKRLNDSYGHLVGDEVLRNISGRVREAIRPYDAVGRFGGEEFIIVFPGCDERSAASIAERIQKRINDSGVETQKGALAVTMSFGVTTLAVSGSAGESEIKALIEKADRALYQAKNRGRNCVITAS
jgi:diguanylate cyclase (GGDEF)-like protein